MYDQTAENNRHAAFKMKLLKMLKSEYWKIINMPSVKKQAKKINF